MNSDFRTKDWMVASYLIAVCDAPEPRIEGKTLIFDDPDGELRWGAECFTMDESMTKFASAFRKIRNLCLQQR